MEANARDNKASGEVAFFYHLGDIVYYNGLTSEYYPQFYEPYGYYPAPIFAIPGNHDGDPFLEARTREPREPSLFGWRRNFCSTDGGITEEAGDSARRAIKLPNPFWTLETQLANFIGLYTNVPEGGEIRADQRAWLVAEFKHAVRDASKALFLCLHHPVFSADTFHSGSPAMKELVDAAIQESGAHPDI